MDQYATHVLAAYGVVSVCFGVMIGISLVKWFRVCQDAERRQQASKSVEAEKTPQSDISQLKP